MNIGYSRTPFRILTVTHQNRIENMSAYSEVHKYRPKLHGTMLENLWDNLEKDQVDMFSFVLLLFYGSLCCRISLATVLGDSW